MKPFDWAAFLEAEGALFDHAQIPEGYRRRDSSFQELLATGRSGLDWSDWHAGMLDPSPVTRLVERFLEAGGHNEAFRFLGADRAAVLGDRDRWALEYPVCPYVEVRHRWRDILEGVPEPPPSWSKLRANKVFEVCWLGEWPSHETPSIAERYIELPPDQQAAARAVFRRWVEAGLIPSWLPFLPRATRASLFEAFPDAF